MGGFCSAMALANPQIARIQTYNLASIPLICSKFEQPNTIFAQIKPLFFYQDTKEHHAKATTIFTTVLVLVSLHNPKRISRKSHYHLRDHHRQHHHSPFPPPIPPPALKSSHLAAIIVLFKISFLAISCHSLVMSSILL